MRWTPLCANKQTFQFEAYSYTYHSHGTLMRGQRSIEVDRVMLRRETLKVYEINGFGDNHH